MVVDGRGSSPLLPDGSIPREKDSGLHCKRDWVGPRAKLDRMEREIFLHLQEKRPRPRSLLLNRLSYASSHF